MGTFTVEAPATYRISICGNGQPYGTADGGSGAAWRGTVKLPAGDYKYSIYGPRSAATSSSFRNDDDSFVIKVPAGSVNEIAPTITDTNSYIQTTIISEKSSKSPEISHLGNDYGKGGTSGTDPTSGYLSIELMGGGNS